MSPKAKKNGATQATVTEDLSTDERNKTGGLLAEALARLEERKARAKDEKRRINEQIADLEQDVHVLTERVRTSKKTVPAQRDLAEMAKRPPQEK